MLQIQAEHDLEYLVLKEWEHVQTYLLKHIPAPSAYPLATWREKIAEDIARCTKGNVQIWWEPVASEYRRESDLCKDVCAQQTRYGVLKFAPGYLSSALFPNLPQMLADLCGHLFSLVEHQAMIQALQRALRPLYEHEREMLTKREWDVLQQMLLGESETEIARTLNISLTTVRTHRHHIYQRLGVHSPHEAILRSFELGLGNWLDAPCTTTSHALE